MSLKTGKSQILVSGYGVKLIDWIGPAHNELAITYYDCWECEAATVFTTIHFARGIGWAARWPNKSQQWDYPQPGAVVQTTDLEESDDEIVNQVFAVIKQPGDWFAAGSWFHSRNTKTGKVDDDVERYSINPRTGIERVDKLARLAALIWERLICNRTNTLTEPSIGQDSKACRSVLKNSVK